MTGRRSNRDLHVTDENVEKNRMRNNLHNHKALMAASAFAMLVTACSGAGASETEQLADKVFEMPTLSDVQANELARFTASQELVSACMQQAGFEYIIPEANKVVTVSGGGFVETEAATAAELGYGISIVLVEDSEQPGTEADVYVDPNELYLTSVGESERASWQATYRGDEDVPGCAAAGDSAFQQLTSQDEVLALFADQLEELYDRASSDGTVIDGIASWVSCMQNQGFYDYAYPEDAVYDVRARFEAQGTSDDATLQDELQSFERQVAVADAQCPFNNFGGWEVVLENTYAQYEQQFVEQNSAQILAALTAEESS